MALNNTYERQARANPTALNPNQHYVEQYDAMADLANSMNQFGQTALNMYAKADYAAAEAKTEKQFNDRETDKKDMKRNVELKYENDPEKREAAYLKGLEAINKKYDSDLDIRFQKEYDAKVDLADKKDLLDLRFNATKDLNKIRHDTYVYNINETAKQTVGANEAYIKILDGKVAGSLNKALNDGLISKLEYQKLLDGYNHNKTIANLDNLLVTDPETLALNLSKNAYGMKDKELKTWKSKAESALKLKELRGAATLDAEHRANINTAFDMISKGGTVPQNLMNNFSEKEQKAIGVKQMYASQGYDVPTNVRTYAYLQDMYSNHPARFKSTNLYEYAGELSTEDLSAFQQAQDSIIIDQEGKAKTNPEVKVATDLMNMAYERLGYKAKSGNYEEKYNFNRLVNEEMKAQMHDKGRMLTTGEQEQIINDMTKKVAIRGFWSSDQFATQVDVSEDTPYVDYDKIPQEEKIVINNMFVRNNIDLSDFDDDDRETFYEDMAGALSLPKANQSAAIERVIREVNKKARKMNADGVTDAEKEQRRKAHKYSAQDYLDVIPLPTETPYGY